MDDNVMHIFGFVIKPIHVSVFYNSIFLLMGAGSIYAWFKTRWQSRGNRHMHRYVHSVNEVSDVDREGYRTLKLRNLGMVEHVDTGRSHSGSYEHRRFPCQNRSARK
jgi:hypothetical protein